MKICSREVCFLRNFLIFVFLLRTLLQAKTFDCEFFGVFHAFFAFFSLLFGDYGVKSLQYEVASGENFWLFCPSAVGKTEKAPGAISMYVSYLILMRKEFL